MKTFPFTRASGLSLCIIAALLALAVVHEPRQTARPDAPEGTVYVPGGTYVPLYADASAEEGQVVVPFYVKRHPVTNGEFLAFLKANPSWRRSQVRSIFAEPGYLAHWDGDLDFGADSLSTRPVVNVSWFAARAYADWAGMRLPTTAEWEFVAAAGLWEADAGDEPEYRRRLQEWYSRPAADGLASVGTTGCNYWGACDLHGLVWEWVDDFNSALVTGESRNNEDLDLSLFCGTAATGASDFDDYAAFLRFGFRSGLEAPFAVGTLGFRVAADARG